MRATVVLEEAGAVGGLVTLLQAQTPPGRPQYTLILLGKHFSKLIKIGLFQNNQVPNAKFSRSDTV